MRTPTTLVAALLGLGSLLLGGCYEETGNAPTQAQQPTPVPQQGPLTTAGQAPASSALGKAKNTAGNIAAQAEQKSREVADQADDIANPD